MVDYVHDHYAVTRRRACRLVRLHRSAFYYRSVKDPKLALRGRMREIARTRVRYGYRRIHVLLRREGWALGKNQAYRLYTEEALQLRSKRPKRRKMLVTRRERFVPRRPNEAWSMDFVADQLTNGQRFRALTIVDVFSREALAIQVGQSLRGEHVVDAYNHLVAQRRAPKRVFVDNGSEFSGRLLDLWAYHHGVRETIELARWGIRFQPPQDPGWRRWDARTAGRQDAVFGMMRQGPAAFFLIGCTEAGQTSLATVSDALATQAERSQQRVVGREATTLNGMQGTLLLLANEGNDPLIRMVEWVTVQHGVAYVLNYWLTAPPASTSAVVEQSNRLFSGFQLIERSRAGETGSSVGEAFERQRRF